MLRGRFLAVPADVPVYLGSTPRRGNPETF